MKYPKKNISGWGNFPKTNATVFIPSSLNELKKIILQNKDVLAIGASKSYGDAGLYRNVIKMEAFNNILAENEDWIEVEAGITIQKLLSHIVKKGKFLPVTPGISCITIGGAVASNVHGKNHQHYGTFANHVLSICLMDINGQIANYGPNSNPDFFYDIFGAMGLTGIIISVKFKLVTIETSYLKETNFFADSIAAVFKCFEQNKNEPFIVGWIDLLNRNFNSVVKTASWALKNDLPNHTLALLTTSASKLNIPFTFPCSPPRFAFKWYNKIYFSIAKKKTKQLLHYPAFFYPLESIKHWNRIFGPKGFIQYHAAFPVESSKEAISQIINTVRLSKATCTLAVIKIFGKEDGHLKNSFPMEGYNIALDFLNNRHTKAIIKQLDALVLEYKGRIYKCKDSLSSLPSPLYNASLQSNQNCRYAKSRQQ